MGTPASSAAGNEAGANESTKFAMKGARVRRLTAATKPCRGVGVAPGERK